MSGLTTNWAQYTSIDNHTGSWYDSDSWIGGESPGMSIDGEDISCYGWLTAENCLDYDNGQFRIYDTLIVYGTFSLLNKGQLFVEPGGILIVFGDYYSGLKAEVENGGYVIVTGEFEMKGPDNQGFFHNNGGKVYIFDEDPVIKGGSNYSELACDDPLDFPNNCGYGNEDDLITDPIYSFYNSFGYDPASDTLVSCMAAKFEADKVSVCGSDTVIFFNLSFGLPANAIYTWNFGEGAVPQTVTGRGPHKVVYESSGAKDVVLLATTVKGDSSIKRIDNYIVVEQIPRIVLDDASRCGPGDIIVNANSDNGNIVQFSTDGGLTVADEAISDPFEFSVFLDEGQNITVWARAIDTVGGCTSDWDETATAYAYTLPDVIMEDASRCGTGDVILSAYTDSINFIQFSTDGGITIAEEVVSAPFEFPVFLNEGQNITVWVNAIDTANGCMSEWNQLATAYAYALPSVIIEDTSRCGTGEVILYAYSDSNIIIQFSTDGGITIADEAISAPFEFPVFLEEEQNITVWARAVDTVGGCISEWDQTATVYAFALPSVIMEDSSRCGMGEVLMHAYSDSSNIIQFSTDGGITIASEVISAPFEFPVFLEEGQNIIVWVNAIDTANGCISEWNQMATANAYELPVVIIEDTSRCGRGEVILNANTDDGNIVQFSTDGGITILNEVYLAPYEFPIFLEEWNRTVVWARAIDPANSCMSDWDQSAEVFAYPEPEVNIVGNSIICDGEELFLTVEDDSFIERYLWHDGSTMDSYTTNIDEVVYVTAWNNVGCQNSDTIIITRCETMDLFISSIYTISPNADGLNDKWILDNIEYYPEVQIWIYDESGKLVFHSPGGYQNDWDGTYNGQLLPIDSYYFYIDLSKYDMESVTGLITLVYLN